MMARPAPEFHHVDRQRFETEIVATGRPAILRGLVSDWPIVTASRKGSDSLAAWLRKRATNEAAEAWFGAPEIGGRFDFMADHAGLNHERKLATIAQLLDLILAQRDSASPWSVYAGALPVRKHLAAFTAENPMPLLDTDRHMLVSLWLGNRTTTAAHWDLPQNLACVVAGRRRFTLFPTDQVANLYVGPIDRTLAGQPSSMIDIEHPDLERFPRFADAMDAAEIAELEPGDALYMPSLWWHGVTSPDSVGAMVNYWWRDGPARMTTPMQSLLHAAMTMRELPERELAAWKHLFDHYIFREHGDPLEHVAPDARGILGERSPELIAAVKAMLAEPLKR